MIDIYILGGLFNIEKKMTIKINNENKTVQKNSLDLSNEKYAVQTSSNELTIASLLVRMDKLEREMRINSNSNLASSAASLELGHKEVQLKKILLRLCHVDNFKKVVETENIAGKLLWLLIFLGALGGTVWIVILSIQSYLKYDVITKIEKIDERPAKFPAVTICNANPFTSLHAQDLIEKFINETYGFNYFYSTDRSIQDIFSMAYSAGELALLHVVTADEYKSYENKSKLAKKYLNGDCTFSRKPCVANLSWLWSFDFGNCFQFNADTNSTDESAKIQKVGRAGKEEGFQIQLGPMKSENKRYPLYTSGGVYLFVHDPAFGPTYSQGISVQEGQNMYVAVSRTITRKQPRPYSDCVDLASSKSDLYKYIRFTLKQAYRQQDCLDLCFQKKVIAKCKCYHPKYPMVVANTPACRNLPQLYCSYAQITQMNSSVIEDDCAKNECPLECETVTYDTEVSSLTYTDETFYEFYLRFYPQGYTYAEFRKNFLVLNVYLTSTEYTLITQAPKMAPVDLFANIGGSMGIFMGLSVYHLVEVLEILFVCVLASFRMRRSN